MNEIMRKNAKWWALIGVALLGGAVVGYRLASREAQPQAQREVLYWHDPMVPNAKFDQPGKSPFMDMQLVPVYVDDTAADAAGVRISANVAQNLGVRLGTVQKRALPSRLDAVGSVVFDERLTEVVQARASGYVTTLHVKAPLVTVRRGQPLIEVQVPQWLAAQQDYLTLLDAGDAASKPIRDAVRQRLVVLGVPESAIAAIEKDRKTHATTTLFAPVDGVVTELGVRQGSTFVADAPLLRINGLTTVWIDAQVPESDVSRVDVGSRVTAQATAWPGVIFNGRVLALLPQIDAQTRTLTARLAIDNPQRQLLPGMFVSLRFTLPAVAPQLVVPDEAIIATGQRSVVIVARDGAFEAKEVTTGRAAGGVTEVLAGLEEGQSVVLSGQFLIDSEANLRSAVQRLNVLPEPAPAHEPAEHPQ